MGRSCASLRPRHSCVHAHQMDIQVQRAAEALNQGDGPCVSRRYCITGFSGQASRSSSGLPPERDTFLPHRSQSSTSQALVSDAAIGKQLIR
jgi:hypothetical protein